VSDDFGVSGSSGLWNMQNNYGKMPALPQARDLKVFKLFCHNHLAKRLCLRFSFWLRPQSSGYFDL